MSDVLLEKRTYADGGRSGAFSSGCTVSTKKPFKPCDCQGLSTHTFGWRRYFRLASTPGTAPRLSRLKFDGVSCFVLDSALDEESSAAVRVGEAREASGATPR